MHDPSRYICPPRKDLGDFLQELPTQEGVRFLKDYDAPAPRNPDEFAAAWKASKLGKATSATQSPRRSHQSASEGAHLLARLRAFCEDKRECALDVTAHILIASCVASQQLTYNASIYMRTPVHRS